MLTACRASRRGRSRPALPCRLNEALARSLGVGDAVRFSTVVRSPMGPLSLSFDGAVSGAALGGTCATQFGNMQFRGERA